VQLALRGEHQVSNAALAGAVALAMGVEPDDVAAGLADAESAAHRMMLVRTRDDVLVLDDSYNSSPTSAAAAVRALARLRAPGRHVAVLGDMLELGIHGDEAHDSIGALAAEMGVDLLVAVGERREQLAAAARRARVTVVTAPDAATAARAVADAVHPGDAVLVKASRAVGLEIVTETLSVGKAST
jgi:UDP-N-acetylmuramoyl-tripeptide--D-alanyl-D-alanine ligase